jgi:hypothetical protein
VGYFGVARSLVTALRGGELQILSESNSAAEKAAECSTDFALHFCSDVVKAGSSLVLEDATHHRVFAQLASSATSFYAGAPVLCPDGIALGT